MTTYSASYFIGKTLYAAARVPLYRVPIDSAAPYAYVESGRIVGVVYSYVNVKPGYRSALYWMFYDGNGRPYYSPMLSGLYSESALRDQGVISTKEQLEEEKKKQETTAEYLKKMGKTVVFGGLTVAALAAFLKYRKN